MHPAKREQLAEAPEPARALREADRELPARAHHGRHVARLWLLAAVGSLAISGFLAIGVMAARIPVVARQLTATDFARRVLVVHVDLGVVVWMSALPLALAYFWRATVMRAPLPRVQRIAPWLAGAGGLLMLTGLLPSGEAVTANFIPVVAQPVFVAGLALYFLGAAVGCLGPGLLGGRPSKVAVDADDEPLPLLPPVVAETLRAGSTTLRFGVAYLLVAIVALGISRPRLPEGLTLQTLVELLMWGPGHVLQFVSTATVVVVWMLLAAWGSGRAVQSPLAMRGVALAIGLPVAPILVLVAAGPLWWGHRVGFTRLMQWGLFPAALLALALVLAPHFARRSKAPALSRGALWNLAASVVLMLTGFLFGASIRGSDTRIPGHYHACLGAVTLAYMAISLLLVARSARAHDAATGDAPPTSVEHALRWIGVLYGIGQLTFASGLMVAGGYGLGRKTYGVEQQLDNHGQHLGLLIVAVGGVLAFAGGVVWTIAVWRELAHWRAARRRARA